MASTSTSTAAPTETTTAMMASSRVSEYGILCNRFPEVPATAYDSIIVIKVTQGKITREFPIYRGVLCFHSDFFKRVLSNRWEGESTSTYEIADRKIATFEMFFNWMNTGHLFANNTLVEKWKQVEDLYLFADFYAIVHLKNCAMEAWLHLNTKKSSFLTETIEAIYANTPAKDHFRKLLAEVGVDKFSFDAPNFNKDTGNGYEYLLDIIRVSRAKDKVPGKGRKANSDVE